MIRQFFRWILAQIESKSTREPEPAPAAAGRHPESCECEACVEAEEQDARAW